MGRRLLHLLAAALGAALLFGLSRAGLALLFGVWALLAPLCLMALLENERRGMTRSAGGRGPRAEALLLQRAGLCALLLACVGLIATRLVQA